MSEQEKGVFSGSKGSEGMKDTPQSPPGGGSVKFLTGHLAGSYFPLSKSIITIGRDASNDIAIRDDPSIASHHARLLWQQGGWSVEKHPQAGSVTVNQQQVQRSPIQDEAIIGLGEGNCFLFKEHIAPDETLIRKDVLGQEGSTPASELPSTPVQAPRPTGRFSGLVQGPGQTQIAPLSVIGIPSLEVSSNSSSYRKILALDKPIFNVGRDPTCEVVISDRTVSSHHVQILRQGNQFVLIHPHPERQETLNGLFYQGRKIRGDETFRKTLEHGDIFRIGDENGSFVTLTYNDGRTAAQEELPPMHPIKLGVPEITIGRSSDNTVVLAHPQISGHHARLVREGGSYRIHDLGSTNHVYVNAQLVTNHLLKMGDEIHIGPFKLIYESSQLTQYDESNYIRIDAQNLKRFGNNNVTLLNNISLSIPPRKFVAVVGGSGAGKSMLINALSGLRPANEGRVLYNGLDYYRNLAAFSGQIGYVPQDDIVHRDLTVQSALYYAAKMRLPGDFTAEQIQQRINEVLEEVELTERRGMLIKKLSGGQRKRVSIALELLSNPSLFFLDEPTSGLDPGLDRKMMFLLRKLADKGHTIILVTHATNNINTCDYVCFLAQGGRLAYFGPPDKARDFFGRSDFAEIYSVLEPTDKNGNIPEDAELRFKTSQDYQEYVVQESKRGGETGETSGNIGRSDSTGGADGRRRVKTMTQQRPKRGNPWKQFTLLTMRNLELYKNNVPNLLVLLLQAPLVALLLMLLVRFEIGPGLFDANNIVQCRTQILTTSGPLPIPRLADRSYLVNCDQALNFLEHDPDGVQYAQQRGGVYQALQDFITPAKSADVQRIVFLVALFAVLFGCISGTREIVKETAIYQRERAVNLGLIPYMSSKIIVLGILALLQSASILFIVNVFEPFHQGVFLPVLLENYISLTLAGIAGVLLGLTISAVSPNDDTANSLLAPVIILQVIFAGSVIPLKDWITLAAATLFPTRWTVVALGSSLGLHSDKIDDGKLFGSDYAYHGTLYSIYSQTDATQRILLAWAALGLTIILLTCLIGIVLKMKDGRG
jgi:ABC-type multidrug transport system ATPase subunit/pSer/pThr/pTyr-binding forkhead associated (FHA) protein